MAFNISGSPFSEPLKGYKDVSNDKYAGVQMNFDGKMIREGFARAKAIDGNGNLGQHIWGEKFDTMSDDELLLSWAEMAHENLNTVRKDP